MLSQIVVNAIISSLSLIIAYSSMKPCRSSLNGSFKGNGNAFGCVCELGLIIGVLSVWHVSFNIFSISL